MVLQVKKLEFKYDQEGKSIPIHVISEDICFDGVDEIYVASFMGFGNSPLNALVSGVTEDVAMDNLFEEFDHFDVESMFAFNHIDKMEIENFGEVISCEL